MNIGKSTVTLWVCIVLLLITGCGNPGALYLPEESPPQNALPETSEQLEKKQNNPTSDDSDQEQ